MSVFDAGAVENACVGGRKSDASGRVENVCVGEVMTAQDLDHLLLPEYTSLAGAWILDVSRQVDFGVI